MYAMRYTYTIRDALSLYTVRTTLDAIRYALYAMRDALFAMSSVTYAVYYVLYATWYVFLRYTTYFLQHAMRLTLYINPIRNTIHAACHTTYVARHARTLHAIRGFAMC